MRNIRINVKKPNSFALPGFHKIYLKEFYSCAGLSGA